MSLLPPWVRLAILAGLVVVGFGAGWRICSWRADAAMEKVQLDRQTERTKAATDYGDLEEKNRKIEQGWAESMAQVEVDYEKRISAASADAVSASASADSLRNALTTALRRIEAGGAGQATGAGAGPDGEATVVADVFGGLESACGRYAREADAWESIALGLRAAYNATR